jgi:Flp pilus assembly pilin Flp
MKNLVKCLFEDERGQDLTEYALLLVLVALVAIAVMSGLGAQIESVFSDASASMT